MDWVQAASKRYSEWPASAAREQASARPPPITVTDARAPVPATSAAAAAAQTISRFIEVAPWRRRDTMRRVPAFGARVLLQPAAVNAKLTPGQTGGVGRKRRSSRGRM